MPKYKDKIIEDLQTQYGTVTVLTLAQRSGEEPISQTDQIVRPWVNNKNLLTIPVKSASQPATEKVFARVIEVYAGPGKYPYIHTTSGIRTSGFVPKG